MAADFYSALVHYPDGTAMVLTLFATPEIGAFIREGWVVNDTHVLEGELNGKAYQFEVWAERRPTD